LVHVPQGELVKQTRLGGVLYLENNLSSHVLTPARIAVLQLLVSQAAISLENAHLYTDLEQAKEKARQSERALRLALDSIPALAWSAAPDGSSEVFNRQWHDFTGLSSAEADSGGWQASYRQEDLGKVVDKWRQILAAGQPGEVEARMRRFDGACCRFLIRGTALRDESGKIIRWYGTNTDIEDLKRAGEELRLRETLLRKHRPSWPT
jgi:PAS domain S-box-containing protein